MRYLNFIPFGLAIIAFIYAYMIKVKDEKRIEKINRMLDLAINGQLTQESFDESNLSKLESKFNHYLLGISVSEINLQEQKEKIEALISDISHQTKTPIANISLYSELLRENQAKEYIDEIIFQIEKLKFLIQSLIKASRLEVGVIKLKPTNNSINHILESIIRSIENKAKEKNITIIYKEDENYLAFFDPKWTGEAIYNILDNSLKYSRENSEVRIKILDYPLFLRVDINDNGIGILEEDIPKIFQRFYRAEEVNAIEGVGIGLYLSREIIQGGNGYIKVESQVGKGSTFSVFIPKEKK